MVQDRYKTAIRKSFVHILRNAMDHGIESNDDRKKLSKPVNGHISIEISAENDQPTIKISDDGRGLDIQTIKQEAKRKGLLKEDETYSTEELANLIFSSGFSTAVRVTDISGRGVGMDAVKEFLNTCQCEIKIVLGQQSKGSTNIPFTLKMIFPSDAFVSIANPGNLVS